MTSRSSSALRRKPNSKKAVVAPKADKLPEWNLSDLYSAIDAPEVRRVVYIGESAAPANLLDYEMLLADAAPFGESIGAEQELHDGDAPLYVAGNASPTAS